MHSSKAMILPKSYTSLSKIPARSDYPPCQMRANVAFEVNNHGAKNSSPKKIGLSWEVFLSIPSEKDIILALRDIHKSYDGLKVLRGVSLSARPGTVTSIIGSSGSGKSTLLRCANLLETCQRGDIVFRGKALKWLGEEIGRAHVWTPVTL